MESSSSNSRDGSGTGPSGRFGTAFYLLYRSYDLAAGVATLFGLLPVYLALLLLRRRRWVDIRQSLGLKGGNGTPCVMIHGVSAGEIRAGARLRSVWPRAGTLPLLSFRTRDASATLDLLPGLSPGTDYCRAPWDWSWCVRRWLLGHRVAAIVLVENEIWPGLIEQAARLGIPTLLASGRLYPQDIPRYRLGRALFCPLLHHLAWIGVQDEEQGAAFRAIGAPQDRIEVMGNLKWEPARAQDLPRWMEAELASGPPLVVAGSTHSPEEELLLGALLSRLEAGRVRLLIAPRKTSRAPRILHALRQAGPAIQLWSSWRPGDGWQVLVLDRFGWLPSLYPWAAVAFVGGSLTPRGGQNPLEAISPGTALLAGPHMQHFSAITERLCEAGGILRLDRSADLSRVLPELLDDPDRRSLLAGRAVRVRDRQKAPSQRVLEVLERCFPGS